MKRILFISLLAVLFLGCSKEKEAELIPEEKEQEQDVFSLNGKTYAAYGGQGGIVGFEVYKVYYVYKFTSSTEVELSARRDSPAGEILGAIINYTYKLDYPKLTFTIESTGITATFIDEKTFRTGSGSNIEEYILQ